MVKFSSVDFNTENGSVILNIRYYEDHALEFGWGLIEQSHISPSYFSVDVTDLVLASAKKYKDAKKTEDTEVNLNNAFDDYLEALDLHFKHLNKEDSESPEVDEFFYVIKTKVGGFDWNTLTQNKRSLQTKLLERHSFAELSNGEATIEKLKISR